MQMSRFYNSGKTRPYAYRKAQLIKLSDAVKKYEKQIHDALYSDLKKSPEECWVTETGFLLAEIRHTLKHLKSWMQPELVPTNLLNLPSKSYVLQEPLGVVLIISPWNYPFQLLMTPLAGAIAAGNCVMLKASEFAPAFGLITFGVIICGILLVVAAAFTQSMVAIVLAIVIAIVAVIAMALIHSALSGIYAAALYRYATDGKQTPGFDSKVLEGAFLPKK